MRVPRSWMQQFLSVEIPLDDLVELLNMGIAEVEAVEEMDGDPVLVLALKPDRGDCLSILGIAREVAALGGIELREPAYLKAGKDASQTQPGVVQGVAGSDQFQVKIRVDSADLCRRYVGIVLTGVTVGPSPDKVQRLLVRSGIRPINNVVDATALLMLEMGQPFHAFDVDTLNGPEIVVRRARADEKILALNGQEYALPDQQLVIADQKQPVAIAGVMGGEETGVTESTTRVLLESACFDSISVKLTSRALGMHTDASHRFERRVDPAGCLAGAHRLAAMLQETAGAAIHSPAVDIYPEVVEDRAIRLRPSRVSRILGSDIASTVVEESLLRLGLGVDRTGDEFLVTVPSRRPDLAMEEDLVEEVARVVGYNTIPTTLPVATSTPGGVPAGWQAADVIRDALVGSGYTEMRSYSLSSPEALVRGGESGQAAVIRNPTSADRTVLRTAILPSLLEAAENNVARGFRDQHLFEIGRVFLPREGERPDELPRAAGLGFGQAWTSSWNLPEAVTTDYFAVRGVLENAAAALRVKFAVSKGADHPAFHPGRSARVLLEGETLGVLGELHPEIVARYSLPGRPVAFELAMNPLIAVFQDAQRRPIQGAMMQQPAATRDLAVVVPTKIPYQRVVDAIRAAHPLLEEVHLFDLYHGPGIPEGHQSMAFSLTFRHARRTLTDAETSGAMDEILRVLDTQVGARRR